MELGTYAIHSRTGNKLKKQLAFLKPLFLIESICLQAMARILITLVLSFACDGAAGFGMCLQKYD
jgi:hypothetical protein